MGWQERYADRIVSPEQAVRLVKSGDVVKAGLGAAEPATLVAALLGRRNELRDVSIEFSLSAAPADTSQEKLLKAFTVRSIFVGPATRQAMKDRALDYRPAGFAVQPRQREDGARLDATAPDVFLVRVSPPDEHGLCSFGHQIWFNKSYALHAKSAIAEISPTVIRTHGDNSIPFTRFACVVESMAAPPAGGLPLADERVDVVHAIGGYVGTLVRDGDTVQFGGGTTSGAMPAFLEHKEGLGIHTEWMPAGALQLVRAGVINGRRKTAHQDKAVCTAISAGAEEIAWVHDNPAIELYDMEYTNNHRLIAAHDNMVAINNALAIDLTGQVTAESFGPVMWSGAGGQLDFVVGALLAKGGRSITVLPSTARGGTVSRIVSSLEPGTIVTVPRTLADYVVTEYGIVNLQGRSQRQRAEALISIAHPDFRAELRQAAQTLYYP